MSLSRALAMMEGKIRNCRNNHTHNMRIIKFFVSYFLCNFKIKSSSKFILIRISCFWYFELSVFLNMQIMNQNEIEYEIFAGNINLDDNLVKKWWIQ